MTVCISPNDDPNNFEEKYTIYTFTTKCYMGIKHTQGDIVEYKNHCGFKK